MQSPEYDTIVESTPMLVRAISRDVGSVTDGLIGTGIIPDQLKEELRLSTLTSTVKAQKIVDYVADYVKQSKAYYSEFVQVLKKQGKWMEPCINDLEKSYKAKAQATSGDTQSSSTRPDITFLVSHIDAIVTVLKAAQGKWRFIGKGIGVEDQDLEEIQDRYPQTLMCLYEMLKSRIQRGGLTRSMLCESLRGDFVGRDDVAQAIEALDL